MVSYETSFDTADAGILAVFGAFFLVIVVVGLVMYLLQSFAMMKMAQNAGIENGWLAFIPIANYWIYGELVSEKLGGNGGKKALLTVVVLMVLSLVPFLNILASIASVVFGYVLMYWLLSKYSENGVIWFVVSFVTLSVSYPFTLFALRNNKARY